MRATNRSSTALAALSFALLMMLPAGIIQNSLCQAQENTSAATSVSPRPSLKESVRFVYVPSSAFRAVTTSLPRGRFMDMAEVQPLIARLWDRQRFKAFPAGDAVVLQGRYDGTLQKNTIELSGDLELLKIGDGWSLIPLKLAGVTLRELIVDGEPWMVLRQGDSIVVPLQGAGSHRIGIAGTVPVEIQQGNPSARFQLPAGAAGQLALRLPPERRLLVDGELLEGSDNEGNKIVLVPLPHDRPLGLAAILEEQEAQRRTVLVARHRCDYTIQPDGVDLVQQTRLTVYAFPIQEVVFQLPVDLELVEVTAPQLTRWQLSPDEGGRVRLSLLFREPFRGQREVTIKAVMPRADAEGVLELPRVLLSAAASQTGVVVVRTEAGLRSEVVSLEGARYLNLAELIHEKLDVLLGQQGQLRALGFWTPDYAVRLYVHRVNPELLVGAASVMQVSRFRARLQSSITLETRYGPLADFTLALPASWELASVRRAGDNSPLEWRAEDTEDRTLVHIQFTPPVPEGRPAVIVLEAERPVQIEPQSSLLELPFLAFPDATAAEGSLVVAADNSLSIRFLELQGLEPAPPGVEPERVLYSPQQRIIRSFRYVGAHSGKVELLTRSPRIVGQILLLVLPERSLVRARGVLEIANRGAPTDSITLLVPEPIAANFRIPREDTAAAQIKEIRSDPPQDGSVAVRVVLAQPFSGKLRLPIQYNVETSDQDQAAIIPLPWLASAEAVEGHVAVSASVGLEVLAQGEQAESVPVATLPESPLYRGEARIVSAFTYRSPNARLRLKLRQHDVAGVPDCYCPRISLKTALRPGGVASHTASILVRAAGRQYLRVTLPAGGRLRAALVNGEPITVHPSGQSLSVPLPVTPAPTQVVTLFYDTDPVERGYALRSEQVAPEVNAPVGQLVWTVQHPPEYELTAVEGDVVLRSAPAPRNLLWQSVQQAMESVVGVCLFALLGALPAGLFVLVARRAQKRKGKSDLILEILGILAIMALIAALLLPSVQSARYAARHAQCHSNLRQLYMALKAYHSEHGRYPPAAIGPRNVPLDRQFSWVVALLPYLDREDLYNQLDLSQPVDSPVNASVLEGRALFVLHCPSSLASEDSLSYLAVLGAQQPGTGILRGVFDWERSLSVSEIADPAEGTLLLVETVRPARWYVASEAAILIDATAELTGIGGHVTYFHGLFADGTVAELRTDTPGNLLARMASATGGDGPWSEELDMALYRRKSSRRVALEQGWLRHALRAPVATNEIPVATASAPAETAALELAEEASEAELQAQAEAEALRPSDRAAVGRALAEGEQKAEGSEVARGVRPQAAPGLGGQAAASQHARGRQGGARLSLRLEPASRDWPTVQMVSYDGDARVTFYLRDRRLTWGLVGTAMGLVFLLAWWVRKSQPVSQVALAILVAGAGGGIARLIPALFAPVAEGVALGALLWLLAVVLVSATNGTRRRRAAGKTISAPTTLLVLLATVACPFATSRSVHGDELAPEELQPIVVVPYDPADGIPTRPVGVVYVPEVTLRLLGISESETSVPDPVPLGSVTAIVVEGNVNETAVDLTATFRIRCLTDDPTLILLPIELAGVTSATLDGDAFSALHQVKSQSTTGGKGRSDEQELRARTAAVVQGKGPHELVVRFQLPVRGTSRVGEVVLPFVECPPGELRLQLPERDPVIEITGLKGGHETLPAGNGGGVRIVAALEGANRVTVSWRPAPRARAEASVVVEQHTLIDVQESGVHLRSRLLYEVHNSAVNHVRVALPEGIAVLAVEGPDVSTWEVSAEDRSPVLDIQLKRRVEGRTELRIDMLDTSAPPEGRYVLRLPQVREAVREFGTVAIGCGTQFRIHVEQTGMRQIPRELAHVPDPHQPDFCAILGAYQYSGRDWQMALEINRYVTSWQARAATFLEIGDVEWTLIAQLDLSISDGPLGDIRINVDRRLRLKELRVNRPADWLFDGDRGVISVHLREPTAEPVVVRLEATVIPESTDGERQLLLPTVEGARRQESELAVAVQPGLEVRVTFPGSRPLAPDALHAAWLRAHRGAIRYAAIHQGERPLVTISVTRQRPRVQATTLLVFVLDRDWTEYMAEVHLDVRGGALRQLRLLMPSSGGTGVEIAGASIAQRLMETVDQEKVRWTIDFSVPVTGEYRLYLWQRMPTEGDRLVLPWLQIEDVDRQDSFVAVRPQPRVLLREVARSGLDTTRMEHVPPEFDRELLSDAAWLFRATAVPFTLEVERTLTQVTALPEIEVFLAHHRTLLDVSGRYRTELTLLVRNTTRQYLGVSLPEGAELLGASVDGEAVPVSRGGQPGQVLVPLAETPLHHVFQRVVLVFEGETGSPLSWRARWSLPVATLAEDVPVAYSLWSVHAPEGIWMYPVDTNLEKIEQNEAKLIESLAISEAAVRAWQAGLQLGESSGKAQLYETLTRLARSMKDLTRRKWGKGSAGYEYSAKLQGNVQRLQEEVERFQAQKDTDKLLQKRFEALQRAGELRKEVQARERVQRFQREAGGVEGKLGELRRQSLEQLGMQVQQQPSPRLAGKPAAPPQPAQQAQQEPRASRTAEFAGAPTPRAYSAGRVGMDVRITRTTNTLHLFKTKGNPRLTLEVVSFREWPRWRDALAVALLLLGVSAILAAVWLSVSRPLAQASQSLWLPLAAVTAILTALYVSGAWPPLAAALAFFGGMALVLARARRAPKPDAATETPSPSNA